MIVAWLGAASAGTYRSIAVEVRASYFVADGLGVPDATRVGLSVGHRRLWTPGAWAVGVAIPVVYGHSEAAGYSYRWGVQGEIARPFEREGLALYLSAGLNYFVSQGWDEARFGPGWRLALGLRLFGEDHWEVGVEPLAIERMPNGPGAMTPLRSRYGWDLTFLTLGVTW